MDNNIENILDECIDRINAGDTLEACLADFPQQAKQIEPLLKAMIQTKTAYEFTPSDESIRESRKSFYDALDKRRRCSVWGHLLNRRLALSIAVSVIVVLVGAYVGLKMIGIQSQTPIILASSPSVDGNFVFLVSDEVNALSDFSDLNVNVDAVRLLQSGNAGEQIEFYPETQQFDLTLLPGDVTQQLWRGNVPEGQYSEVVITVSKVTGILKSTGDSIEIKLPSNKLQMSKPFEVSPDNVTSFVYDLTLVKAGNSQNGGKYLLKPQIDQSGSSHTPKSNPGKSKSNPKQ